MALQSLSLGTGNSHVMFRVVEKSVSNLVDLKKKKLVKTISFKRQKLLKLNRSHLDVFFNKNIGIVYLIDQKKLLVEMDLQIF